MRHKMVTDTIAKELAQSFRLNVAAVALDNTSPAKNSTTPLSFKIRIRTNRDSLIKQGVISVPKPEANKHALEPIKLSSSDQTLVSFNMLMDSQYEKKPQKKRNNFFSMLGCFSIPNEDDDDTPYTPSTGQNEPAAFSEGAYTSKSKLKENMNKHYAHFKSLEKTDKRIFGSSKPGGCLDPPFGEDRYAYMPSAKQAGPVIKNISEDIISKYCQKNILSKSKQTASEKFRKKNRKQFPHGESVKHKKDSVEPLLTKDGSIPILNNKNSDSLITYPPEELFYNGTVDDKKATIKKVLNKSETYPTDELTTFYVPPSRDSFQINSGEHKVNNNLSKKTDVENESSVLNESKTSELAKVTPLTFTDIDAVSGRSLENVLHGMSNFQKSSSTEKFGNKMQTQITAKDMIKITPLMISTQTLEEQPNEMDEHTTQESALNFSPHSVVKSEFKSDFSFVDNSINKVIDENELNSEKDTKPSNISCLIVSPQVTDKHLDDMQKHIKQETALESSVRSEMKSNFQDIPIFDTVEINRVIERVNNNKEVGLRTDKDFLSVPNSIAFTNSHQNKTKATAVNASAQRKVKSDFQDKPFLHKSSDVKIRVSEIPLYDNATIKRVNDNKEVSLEKDNVSSSKASKQVIKGLLTQTSNQEIGELTSASVEESENKDNTNVIKTTEWNSVRIPAKSNNSDEYQKVYDVQNIATRHQYMEIDKELDIRREDFNRSMHNESNILNNQSKTESKTAENNNNNKSKQPHRIVYESSELNHLKLQQYTNDSNSSSSKINVYLEPKMNESSSILSFKSHKNLVLSEIASILQQSDNDYKLSHIARNNSVSVTKGRSVESRSHPTAKNNSSAFIKYISAIEPDHNGVATDNESVTKKHDLKTKSDQYIAYDTFSTNKICSEKSTSDKNDEISKSMRVGSGSLHEYFFDEYESPCKSSIDLLLEFNVDKYSLSQNQQEETTEQENDKYDSIKIQQNILDYKFNNNTEQIQNMSLEFESSQKNDKIVLLENHNSNNDVQCILNEILNVNSFSYNYDKTDQQQLSGEKLHECNYDGHNEIAPLTSNITTSSQSFKKVSDIDDSNHSSNLKNSSQTTSLNIIAKEQEDKHDKKLSNPAYIDLSRNKNLLNGENNKKILINLALKSFISENDQVELRSVDANMDPGLDDTVIFINDYLVENSKQISLSIGDSYEISIQLKAEAQTDCDSLEIHRKTSVKLPAVKSVQFSPVYGMNDGNDEKLLFCKDDEIDVLAQHIASNLQINLASIYDKELVPLGNLIKALRKDLDMLKEQIMSFKGKVQPLNKQLFSKSKVQIINMLGNCNCLLK